jgi:hypothetical protein
MRPLHVGVLHEGSGRGFGSLQVSRPNQSEALFLIGPVVPFDKAILLGVMGITDVDVDTQTGSKPDEGRRKITTRGTAHEAADRDRA